MHTISQNAQGKLSPYGHQEARHVNGREAASAALKKTARDAINRAQSDIVGLSHQLHANPELAFAEYESAQAITDLLERRGFEIERGIADLETAFVATSGHGELVVAFCAEMDALPEVGHACGHNVIAAASVAAAIALAEVADSVGVCVKVFGTPAEEAGGGKIIMLEAGAFDGVHAAMMVHPATKEYADHHTRAVVGLRASYTGRTAHSALAPHEGINAGDAATVAQVAIGLLRQQLRPGALVHGIVTKGGEAANSIPGAAELIYDARANNVKELAEVKNQLIACFEAGAVATGASLHISDETREFSEFRNDHRMVGLYQANAESLGRRFDDEPLEKRLSEAASTDMANVSLAIPSIHPVIRVEADGASNHQPEFARWCASRDADKAALEGGAAMAWTAIDLALDTTERRRLITFGESSSPGAEAADS